MTVEMYQRFKAFIFYVAGGSSVPSQVSASSSCSSYQEVFGAEEVYSRLCSQREHQTCPLTTPVSLLSSAACEAKVMCVVRTQSCEKNKPRVGFWRPEACLSWCKPRPILTCTSCFRLRRVRHRNWQSRRAFLRTFLLPLRPRPPHRYLTAHSH